MTLLNNKNKYRWCITHHVYFRINNPHFTSNFHPFAHSTLDSTKSLLSHYCVGEIHNSCSGNLKFLSLTNSCFIFIEICQFLMLLECDLEIYVSFSGFGLVLFFCNVFVGLWNWFLLMIEFRKWSKDGIFLISCLIKGLRLIQVERKIMQERDPFFCQFCYCG